MGSHEADYNEALLELDLGGGTPAFQPFRISSHLTDGVFLSSGERLQVRLRTADHPKGTGFKAVYRTGQLSMTFKRCLSILFDILF